MKGNVITNVFQEGLDLAILCSVWWRSYALLIHTVPHCRAYASNHELTAPPNPRMKV